MLEEQKKNVFVKGPFFFCCCEWNIRSLELLVLSVWIAKEIVIFAILYTDTLSFACMYKSIVIRCASVFFFLLARFLLETDICFRLYAHQNEKKKQTPKQTHNINFLYKNKWKTDKPNNPISNIVSERNNNNKKKITTNAIISVWFSFFSFLSKSKYLPMRKLLQIRVTLRNR